MDVISGFVLFGREFSLGEFVVIVFLSEVFGVGEVVFYGVGFDFDLIFF